ncbi:MAG: DsbA family protein [Candidatus Binatia bacterium]|nr:DsbA family protein [Candidatus Binatia bacterium]
MSLVRLIVYSDYLCPWCYNASVRLRRLEEEMSSDLEIVWRSYLLRPEPKARNVEKFRAYTQSWARPGEEEDSGTFRPWASDAPPPTHSVPAHVVAKAAATLDPESFHKMHDALLRAYFTDNRDISDESVLEAIWNEQALPRDAFARSQSPEILAETLEDFAEAQSLGITGAPAARLEGNEAFLTGALPVPMYRRWIERQIAARSTPATH